MATISTKSVLRIPQRIMDDLAPGRETGMDFCIAVTPDGLDAILENADALPQHTDPIHYDLNDLPQPGRSGRRAPHIAMTRYFFLLALVLAVPSLHADDKPGTEKEIAGIKLCWCPPGKFMMGSPEKEPAHRPDEKQVEVTLTRGFWTAKYETTQGQWKRVMGKLPGKATAELPEGDDLPVGDVNFAQAEAFCARLTELGKKDRTLPRGWEFRLPTEAQWEYACRAGSTTATSFGNKLSTKQANFKNVGSYPANPWGIHDMHGNTFEWCRDWYHAKLPGGTDPDLYDAKATTTKNRDGSVSRVRRGAAWTDEGKYLRSGLRLRYEPERGYDHIGFRVVVVKP